MTNREIASALIVAGIIAGFVLLFVSFVSRANTYEDWQAREKVNQCLTQPNMTYAACYRGIYVDGKFE